MLVLKSRSHQAKKVAVAVLALLLFSPWIWVFQIHIAYGLGLFSALGQLALVTHRGLRMPRWMVGAVNLFMSAMTIFWVAAIWMGADGFDASFRWHLDPANLPLVFNAYRGLLAAGVVWLLGVFLLSVSISPFATPPKYLGQALQLCLLLHPGILMSGRSALTLHRSMAEESRAASNAAQRLRDALATRQVLLPESVDASLPEMRRNLVILYLESLEQAYFDVDLFKVDLVPNLRKLQAGGRTFTNLRQVPFTSWTIAGIVSSQCGLPLATSWSNGNQILASLQDLFDTTPCLAQVLEAQGYKTVYMGGADAGFGGKGAFLLRNGYREIYGREQLSSQLTSPDYRNEWGLFDDSLFELARRKLDALSATGQPFLFTLLTLDTHHYTGFLSASCRHLRDLGNSMLNAIQCSDLLVGQFMAWAKEQPWAEQTVFVLLSDHLAMYNAVYGTLESYPRRRLSFSIQGAGIAPEQMAAPGTHFDIPPTILESVGVKSYGHFPLGQSLLGRRSGFVDEQHISDEALGSLDLIRLLDESNRLPVPIVVDAPRAKVTIGRHAYAVNDQGGELQESSVFTLSFDKDGTFRGMRTDTDISALQLGEGWFVIAFSRDPLQLQRLVPGLVVDRGGFYVGLLERDKGVFLENNRRHVLSRKRVQELCTHSLSTIAENPS